MKCNHMIALKNGSVVPCGKCPACKANQRTEWIFRLKEEYKNSSFAIFVTLTYNEENLPLGMNVSKRDIQLFHKRLRKHFPSRDLRFYVVSEYGDHTFRPHYHGLYFFKSAYNKDFIYQVFESSWQNGFIKFGEVEEGSIVYCTKYCLKHTQTPAGRLPTFRLVSKMHGGLGVGYLEKMGDFHAQSMNFDSVFADGARARMPRYYFNCLSRRSDINQLELAQIKLQRRQRIIDSQYVENAKSFFEFCKEHKGLSYDEAVQRFNASQQRSFNARDELIEKHCKKQKL